jgi:hypothetical protein
LLKSIALVRAQSHLPVIPNGQGRVVVANNTCTTWGESEGGRTWAGRAPEGHA